MLRKITCLVFGLLTFFTTKGQANINGSTLQSFNPVSSNGSFVTVQSAKTLTPWSFNVGGFLDQAYNTLPPALDSNNDKFLVSNEILSSDIHLALGVLPRVEIGANMGSILNASVDKDQFSEYYKVRGLTDLRTHLKYHFYEYEKWNFAVNLQAQFPQIENDYFYGSGGVPLYALELITSVHDGQWDWGANLGYNVRPKGDKIPGGAYEPVGDSWLGSLALAHRFSNDVWTAVAELWAAQPVEATANYTQMDLTATEILFGAKINYDKSLQYQAGVTHGTRGGISTPDRRIYLGLNWRWDWKKEEPLPLAPPVVVQVAPPPPPKPVAAPEVGNFVISNFNFKSNSAEVSEDYVSYLKRFADFVRSKPSYKAIVVKGFTDDTGPKDYNLILSQRRADAIKRVLVLEGQLLSEKIQTIGYGIENPIASNKTKKGRQLNRRIELLVEE